MKEKDYNDIVSQIAEIKKKVASNSEATKIVLENTISMITTTFQNVVDSLMDLLKKEVAQDINTEDKKQ